MRKKTQHGFTLIELVVVIAILGILAGIAIPRFMDAQATARGSKILADMRTLESALTMYTVKNTITTNNTSTTGTYDVKILKDAGYIAAVPVPPTGLAKFPAGGTIEIDNTLKYEIHYHKNTGQTFVYLTDGKYPGWDINQLQALTGTN
jgi:prepilin-type N-terminal cleavage/methylation domain-containing protein